VRLSVLQNNHNYAVRDVDDAVRAICASESIALVTYSPLGAGFLTGKHKAGVAPGSRFEVIPGHQRIYFTPQGWQRLARLETVAQHTGLPLPTLALAWAFNQPGPATVLVGGRATAQIDQAFAALALGRPRWLDELAEP
jgi:aryl-alcohol dehydrogenase-like predicted oxidoreductase